MELSIGDFVKHKDNGRFFKITQENITLLSKGTCFEKWQPQKMNGAGSTTTMDY